jgi:hypothetical protein
MSKAKLYLRINAKKKIVAATVVILCLFGMLRTMKQSSRTWKWQEAKMVDLVFPLASGL